MAGAERLAYPPENLALAAARMILARHRGGRASSSQFELHAVTVVLPNLRAAAAFGQTLYQEAGVEVLRLPRLTTLGDWTRFTPLVGESLSNAARELRLYAALKKQNWFPDHNLWQIARELRELADELSTHRILLAASAEEFEARLATAYRTTVGASLRFEARVAFEMWHALALGDEQKDGVARYHQRLTQIARCAAGPLYVVDADSMSPVEAEFFDAYAQHAPVCIIDADLRSEEVSPLTRALCDVWLPDTGVSLRQRAGKWSTQADPLAGTLRLFAASTLEEEAEAVEQTVRKWLLDGKRSIAIVALDRVIARRVRALLERAQVQVQDEAGWTLSTTSAASVLMRLLDCVTGNFDHQDLFDLMKSPFVFGDFPLQTRKTLVHAMEQFARERRVSSGIDQYSRAASAELRMAIDRLTVVAKIFSGRSATIAVWNERLIKALNAIGAGEVLQRDAAGAQLLDLVRLLSHSVKDESVSVSVGEWRQWLDGWLELKTFRDQSAVSSVCVTHLAATRLRHFDAVAMLGSDAAHLPGESSNDLIFGAAVREELGLPPRLADHHRQKRDLLGLIARSESIFVSWQSSLQGEDNLPSAWIGLLQDFHAHAWPDQPRLLDSAFSGRIPAGRVCSPYSAVRADCGAAPAPAFPCPPLRISVSGYASLMNCPYQFYARHLLRLGELEEIRDGMEKRDYGEFIHAILLEFHRRHTVAMSEELPVLEATLKELSDVAFEQSIRHDALARSWWLRWKKIIPEYIAWQCKREQAGWRFKGGEIDREATIRIDAQTTLTLRGRIDRIDQKGDSHSVIDYKTTDARSLRRQLRESGENVQLSCYTLLERNVTEALFVSLNLDAPESVPLEGELAELAHAIEMRLGEIFSRIRSGAGLLANGDESSCDVCEMRGLCRKDFWT